MEKLEIEDEINEQEIAEDELSTELLDYLHNTSISSSDWTSETIFNQMKKGNIILDPQFQRRNAWNTNKKSRLIESIIFNIPIPQIILAESASEKGKFLVIDGKQRLTTIKEFYESQFKISNLEIIKELNGKTFLEIQDDLELSKYVSSLENHTIRTVTIRNYKEEDVLYLIFNRLNTTSLPLSPQELRQSLFPGEFSNFINIKSTEIPKLHQIFNKNGPDPRMRDCELLLRFLAFKLQIIPLEKNLKQFLDESTERFNFSWKSIEQNVSSLIEKLNDVITLAEDIFGEKNIFRKFDGSSYSPRLMRVLFDQITYYLSDDECFQWAKSDPEGFESLFKEFCSIPSVVESFNRPEKIDNIKLRFKTYNMMLREKNPNLQFKDLK